MSIRQRVQAAFQTGNLFIRGSHYLYGKFLFSLPQRTRKFLFHGEQFFCPMCGSHLRKFIPLYRPYHRWCPVCQSLARHRFVWHYFQQGLLPQRGTNLRVLHVAPEKAIQNLFQSLPGIQYLSGDLFNKSAMVKMDICDIHYPDDSFDIIFCSHVLEHVSDDRQALSEFKRVLSSQGQLMLMVPIIGDKTIEDPSIIDPVDRERVFGQLDHVRAYGSDFPEIVRSQGFEVQTYQPKDFLNSDETKKQAIDPTDRLFICSPVSGFLQG